MTTTTRPPRASIAKALIEGALLRLHVVQAAIDARTDDYAGTIATQNIALKRAEERADRAEMALGCLADGLATAERLLGLREPGWIGGAE